MDIAKIHTAVSNVEQGAWVNGFPFDEVGDLALKVRGLFCPDAQRLREGYIASLDPAEREALSPERQESLAIVLICDALVVDWNITDGDAPLACTPEARALVFTDPQIGKVMRAAALYAARNVAQKGAASLEADAKN